MKCKISLEGLASCTYLEYSVLNEKGEEIARLRGDADWASNNAKDILRAIISAQEPAS